MRVWNVEDGRQVLPDVPAEGNWACEDIDFSPDNRFFAVGHGDGSTAIWDLKSKRELRRFSSGPPAKCIRFRPEGTHLAVSRGNNRIEVLDVASGMLINVVDCECDVVTLAWSFDGKRVAYGGNGRSAYIRDLDRGNTVECAGHDDNVQHVVFSRDGSRLASAAWDGMTRLYNTTTGTLLLESDGGAIRFSEDGQWLAFGFSGSDVGRWAVAGRNFFSAKLADDTQPPTGLSATHDDSFVVMSSNRGTRVWDAASGRATGLVPVGKTFFAALLPSRRELVTSGVVGLLRWPVEVNSSAQTCSIGPPKEVVLPHGAHPGAAAVSANGKWFVVCDDSGRRSFRVHLASPHALPLELPFGFATASVSNDGNWIIATQHHGASRVWNVRQRRFVKTLSGIRARCAISPDDRLLAVGTSSEYTFYRMGSWEKVALVDRDATVTRIGAVAFTPEGNIVAVADSTRTIRLLTVKSWNEVITLRLPYSTYVTSIAFTPGSERLICTTADGTIHCWNLRALKAQLKRIGLEWNQRLASTTTSRRAGPASAAQDVLIDRACADWFVERAATYRGQGDLRRAGACMACATTVAPGHDGAWLQLARIRSAEGKPRQALLAANHAINAAPDRTAAYALRATAYLKLQDWANAIADLTAVINHKDHKQDWHHWYHRGFCFNQLKNWHKAEHDLSVAAQLDGGSAELAYVYRERAKARLRLRRASGALDDARKVVQLQPENAALLNDAAWTVVVVPDPSISSSDISQAVEWAAKAVELTGKKNGYYWNTLGVAHYRAGHWTAARDALKTSMALYGGHGHDWYFMAMTEQQLGNTKAAQRYLAKANAFTDSHTDKHDYEELLLFRTEAEALIHSSSAVPPN